MTAIRRALAAAALATALSAGPAACDPPTYAPPVPATFSPCASAQGHLVQDKSTGQLRCES